jgi:hypothetical protein
VIHSQPDSMASAAYQASVTRGPRGVALLAIDMRLQQALIGGEGRAVVGRAGKSLRQHIAARHRHVRALAGDEREATAGIAD